MNELKTPIVSTQVNAGQRVPPASKEPNLDTVFKLQDAFPNMCGTENNR